MQVAVEQSTPTLPASRWREVFCIIENGHRDLALADGVCRGVFTHAGLTLELGARPNWLTSELPADDEWRIEWYKFYFGLDLAHAFAVTSDEKYLDAWKRLVQSWIEQMPVGCDSSDVTARRIQNWIYAWNKFSRNCVCDPEFEQQLIASLAAQVSHLRPHLTAERNHRTLELYALFIASLALPELDHNGLLSFAMTELHRNLLQDIRPDGVHREQSSHYHATALRSFLGARENARRFGLEFPTNYDARLEKACEFLLHLQRPDGSIPALSDADTGNYSDLLDIAALIFNRADFLYAATGGMLGRPPASTCSSFPDGGYFIQRSGWGERETDFRDEKYLIFDCGPLGDGGHGHYDALNIEVAANGRRLIVDPGRFTYAEDEAQWRRRFKGTAAHNTICIDGLDQTPYHRGKPKGAVAQARLLERLTAPGLDALTGEVRSPAYETIHTRRIFFIADEYWLIVDSLRGSTLRQFDLRFHLSAEAWNHCRRISNTHNSGIRTPEMVVLFEAHRRPNLTQGWISKLYGIKDVAPVVSVVASGSANADFYTLVAPVKLSAPLPRFHVESIDPLLSGRIRVEQFGSNVDDIRWATGSARWSRISSSGTLIQEGVAT